MLVNEGTWLKYGGPGGRAMRRCPCDDDDATIDDGDATIDDGIGDGISSHRLKRLHHN